MISKSISWSTWINLASQSEISVVLRRESSWSSARGSGSFLWCSHHSRTFLRTLAETLGSGIAWSDSPTSACARGGVQGCQSCLGIDSGVQGRELTLEHVLDEDGTDGDLVLDLELFALAGRELDLGSAVGGYSVSAHWPYHREQPRGVCVTMLVDEAPPRVPLAATRGGSGGQGRGERVK